MIKRRFLGSLQRCRPRNKVCPWSGLLLLLMDGSGSTDAANVQRFYLVIYGGTGTSAGLGPSQ